MSDERLVKCVINPIYTDLTTIAGFEVSIRLKSNLFKEASEKLYNLVIRKSVAAEAFLLIR